MRSDDDHEDTRCDLPTELRKDLKKVGRNFFDAVCISHTDSDHCRGFGEFFWLEHAAKYQTAHRIKIRELWVPAAAVLEEGLKGDARLVRAEARHDGSPTPPIAVPYVPTRPRMTTGRTAKPTRCPPLPQGLAHARTDIAGVGSVTSLTSGVL